MPKKNDLGFTIIELLVVIAIIGMLASVIAVALGSARAKARDARRREDITQIVTALALYYHENGAYPITGVGIWWGNCSAYGGHPTSGPTGWIPNLAPTHMTVLPVDPKPIFPNGCYLYRSNDGTDFKVLIYSTVESTVAASDPMYDPSGRANSYARYTPGGAGY